MRDTVFDKIGLDFHLKKKRIKVDRNVGCYF